MTRAAMALVVLMALGACSEQSSVEWYSTSIDSTITDSAYITDVVRGEPDQPLAQAGLCLSSLRWTTDGAGGVYAVWWSARADSSVALVAGHSPDNGRTWRAPVPVDTVDHTPTGCDRPPPAIAAEHDNVHIAYS